jgi:hypothetical protein
MNINKNSWHFKLLDYFDHNVIWHLQRGNNVSLCNYFWNVIGALLRVLTIIGGGAVVTVVIGINLYAFFGALMYLLLPLTGPLFDYKLYEVGFAVLIFALGITSVAGICATIGGDMKVVPNYLKRTTTEDDKPPSLFLSWLKAKKDKVCPLVKLEEK